MTPSVDRAAAVRRAMRTLVAAKGFCGATMSAVAAEAGVATGTAYVHYASKDELVLATYVEVKRAMGDAGAAAVVPDADAATRFGQLFLGVHRHLSAEPERARFLVQVDASPFATAAHAAAMDTDDDPLMGEASRPDVAERLAALPYRVLYDLGLGPAVRVVADGSELSDTEVASLGRACWRAITRPG